MTAYGGGAWQRAYDALPVAMQNVITTVYGLQLERRAYGRHYRRFFAELSRTQWLDEQVLAKYQAERMREFLRFAREQTPYWRDTMRRHHFDPDDYRVPQDLLSLPILTKEVVRQEGERIHSAVHRTGRGKCFRIHTGGTTGTALHLLVTDECYQREYAFRWLHRSWAGIRRGDRTATLAGHPVVPVADNSPPFWRRSYAQHQTYFSSQHFAQSALPYYAAEFRRLRPILVYGYPSSVYLVAAHLEERGPLEHPPRGVFTHSETLLPHQRATIERAFGCKAFDWYGNTELCGHVVECERGSLHVKSDHSLMEVLRPDGAAAEPDQAGEIVGTGFGNLATPLIRYATGDSCVLSKSRCGCGRPGPIVQELLGRIDDMVVTPEGRHVGSASLSHVFEDALNVREAQIVQETVQRVTVLLACSPEFSSGDRRDILLGLRRRLGERIDISLEYVDAIPRLPNGKFRAVVSRVAPQIGRARQAETERTAKWLE